MGHKFEPFVIRALKRDLRLDMPRPEADDFDLALFLRSLQGPGQGLIATTYGRIHRAHGQYDREDHFINYRQMAWRG